MLLSYLCVRAWGGGGSGPIGHAQKEELRAPEGKKTMFPILSRPNQISRKPSSMECCTPRVLESIASEGIVNVSHAKADGHVLALTDTGEVRTSDPYFTLKLFCKNRGGGNFSNAHSSWSMLYDCLITGLVLGK